MLQTVYCEAFADAMQPYVYGRFNIIGKKLSVLIDPQERFGLIHGFFHRSTERNDGDCGELRDALYKKLTPDFPELHFYRCDGTEPQYFRSPNDKHAFLLAAERPLFSGPQLSDPDELSEILDKVIVIDPSFHVAAPLEESGYTVRHIFGPQCTTEANTTLVLEPGRYVPLGLGPRGSIVCYGMHKKTVDLQFAILAKNRFLTIDARAPGLFGAAMLCEATGGDRNLEEIVYALRSASVNELGFQEEAA